jgi:hypothetical protein
MILTRFYTFLVQNRIVRAIKNWLLEFIYIQFYVTLLSLPILIAWGLPFSLFSPLGNLLFNPFILVFLLLSSLIFFGALLGLPIDWLSVALDYLTKAWLYCLNCAPHKSSIGFSQPHWIILLLLPLATLAVVHHPLTRPRNRSIGCFILLFLICVLSTLSKSEEILGIPCNKGTITVLHHNKQTIVIDPGLIGQRPSGKQWAQYELIPSITKQTGISHLNTVICLQPTATILQALELMCHTTSIEQLMIPYWEGTASKGMNRAWYNLKRTAENYGTKVSRIGYREQTIPGCPTLSIKPTEKKLTSGDYSYPAMHISGSINGKNLSIFSARLG